VVHANVIRQEIHVLGQERKIIRAHDDIAVILPGQKTQQGDARGKEADAHGIAPQAKDMKQARDDGEGSVVAVELPIPFEGTDRATLSEGAALAL
jgi:hypothetical protein